MADEINKVVILGSGPAGLTAALYTARANLSPLVIEGNEPGGQLMITTEVENYPGFEHGVQGPELMQIMRAQALRFNVDVVEELATKVDFSRRPFRVWVQETLYEARSVIIATGASAKWIGLPEERPAWEGGLGGKGVS